MKKIVLLFVFVCSLMNAHAQTRLSPISGSIYYGQGELTDYELELNKLLLPSYYRFAFIVQPSFKAEYSLVGTDDGKSLILRKADKPIWPLDKPYKVTIKEYKLQIPKAVSDSISKLFESAVRSSSYLCEALGDDGTTFVFISWPNTAECWSPFAGSNCGKLVDLAYSICNAVELQDRKQIEGYMNQITELHHTFKAMYNEKPTDEIGYKIDYDEDDTTHFQDYHFIEIMFYSFLSIIIIGVICSIIFLCSKKRRKYWWVPLLIALLICVVFFGVAYFYITINSIDF